MATGKKRKDVMRKNPVRTRWDFVFSPSILVKTLSSELYRDEGSCLFEIVKNGLVSCMPDPEKWEPERTHVEISLVRNHPIAPGCISLVVMDRGNGFTKANQERFIHIGPDESDGSHAGAAQKRIGRFALFSLNKKLRGQPNLDTGFWILTRTSARGRVTMVEVTAGKICSGDVYAEEINSDATELGPHKGFVGTFSAFVIPNSVFKNEDEIREALRWKLPRRQDRKVLVEVGGLPLEAPPMTGKVVSYGGIDGQLDKLNEVKLGDERSGIFLVDKETGLCCAQAPALATRLPYPLGRADLTGDLLIPGLLAHQSTNRQGLNREYLKSEEWQRVVDILQLRIAPFAQKILGDQDVLRDDDRGTQVLNDIADIFADTWGEGDPIGDDFETGEIPVYPENDDGSERPPKPPGKPRGPRPPKLPTGKPHIPGVKTRPGRRRTRMFRVGKKTYFFQQLRSPDPEHFAHIATSGAITLNPNYGVRLNGPAEREHFIMMILATIAREDEWHPEEAMKLTTRYRLELLERSPKRERSKVSKAG